MEVTEKTLYQIKIIWEIECKQRLQPKKKSRNTASRPKLERSKDFTKKKPSPCKSHFPYFPQAVNEGLWIHENIKQEFRIFDSCSAL